MTISITIHAFLVVSNPHKASLLREVEKSNKSSLVFSLAHEEES